MRAPRRSTSQTARAVKGRRFFSTYARAAVGRERHTQQLPQPRRQLATSTMHASLRLLDIGLTWIRRSPAGAGSTRWTFLQRPWPRSPCCRRSEERRR